MPSNLPRIAQASGLRQNRRRFDLRFLRSGVMDCHDRNQRQEKPNEHEHNRPRDGHSS